MRTRTDVAPTEPTVSWHSARIALPYADARSAAAGLRAELRHDLATRGGTERPDWDTLVLTGPVTTRGGSGRTWFEYTLAVACRPAAA